MAAILLNNCFFNKLSLILYRYFKIKTYFCATEQIIMKKYREYFLLLFFSLASTTVMAQLFEKGTPSVKTSPLPAPESVVFFTDTVNIRETDYKKSELTPLQAGIVLPLDNKYISKNGVWSAVSSNHFVWRVLLKVSSAKALTLYFKNFNLSPSDRLFIYSSDLKQTIGAFTAKNNGYYFTAGLIESSNLIIEFNCTKMLAQLPFEFSQIGVVMKRERGYGDAGSCEVPINCDEGLEWQYQKRGVARILVKQANALFWCTGTLVNNTRNNGKPYFLTANHCGMGSTASDYNQWLFDFNYESANCSRPEYEPEKRTFAGAQLVANGATPRAASSDFKLLLFNEEVPDDYHLFFNGWDRSGDIPQNGVVIHHPAGDMKFISTYTKPAVSSVYYGPETSSGSFWKVYWSETENGHGVTEGGSSGSPLFNRERLIVGALTGGNSSCSHTDEYDYFGKFSVSWDQNGTADANRLKPWLDPDNTGVTKLEGYFKGSNLIITDFNSNVTKIIRGSYVEFNNLSEGNISNYRWEFEGGNPATSLDKEPELIYYDKPGTYGVKLVASSIDNSDSVIRNNYITVIGNIYPNPFIVGNGFHQQVHILTGDTPLSGAEVSVYDIIGGRVQKLTPKVGNHEIMIDPQNFGAGTYVITTLIDGKKSNYKLIVIKK